MKKSMLILTLMVAALCGCAAQQPTTLETPRNQCAGGGHAGNQQWSNADCHSCANA